MRGLADLSIELSHLYIDRITEDDTVNAARLAGQWLTPIIKQYTDRKLSVSTTVMIDDYFVPDKDNVEAKTSSVVDKAELISKSCSDEGIEIDYLVYESACADSVNKMVRYLAPRPVFGDGSSTDPEARKLENWLFNRSENWLLNPVLINEALPRSESGTEDEEDDPFLTVAEQRAFAGTANASLSETAKARQQPLHHAIVLGAELWKVTDKRASIWSCPLLAAWWQLIRLGMYRDADNKLKPLSKHTEPREGAEPFFAKEPREGAEPFFAKRTLTLLTPRFIEVEHAVRMILSQLVLPEEWMQVLHENGTPPNAQEYLERIAYLFIPDSFVLDAASRL